MNIRAEESCFAGRLAQFGDRTVLQIDDGLYIKYRELAALVMG